MKSLVYATYICNQKPFSKGCVLHLTDLEAALNRFLVILWWPSQSYSIEESCKWIKITREKF